MIAPVFHAERLRLCGRPAVRVVAAWQFYDGTTAGAAKRAFSRVKQNRRAAHIAVSGFFLADDGIDALVCFSLAFMVSLPPSFWTQKDRNCRLAITVLLVLLYFGIHWPAHGTGAYLSPSFHLRP